VSTPMAPQDRRPKLVRCKGCNQEIFFARTATGRLIPLDATSLVYETASVDANGTHHVVIRRFAWVSHFRTCPKATEFSRSRSAQPATTTEGPCPPSTSTPAS
jgi:hypothetical protein